MRCEECGCEEFEEKFFSIPYFWGPDIGVIKAHATYWRCKKCGTSVSKSQSPGEMMKKEVV